MVRERHGSADVNRKVDDTDAGGRPMRPGVNHKEAIGETMDSEMQSDDEGQTKLDKQVTDAIGQQLKTTYGQLLSAPIPDKFLKLLDQLEGTPRTPPRDATVEDEDKS